MKREKEKKGKKKYYERSKLIKEQNKNKKMSKKRSIKRVLSIKKKKEKSLRIFKTVLNGKREYS